MILLHKSHARVFVDGTDGARCSGEIIGPAAAGKCAIYQRACGQYASGGYAVWIVQTCADDDSNGFFCGAEKHTNGVAKLSAQIGASLWIAQSGVSSATICYGATYVEKVATALSCHRCNHLLVQVAVGSRSLAERTVLFGSAHVYSLKGHSWN